MSATRVISHSVNYSDIPEQAIREQLERVRASVPFRSSKRCVLFLDYVVQAVLTGQTESLKERTLGVEVFGRAPNYDTNQDPVVRGTASEVRKRLAQYYQTPGNERELRIDLPPGSYAPEFHAPPAEPQPQPVIPLPTAAIVRPHRKTGVLIATAAAIVAIAIAASLRNAPVATAVDQFWKPILSSPGSVLICVGQPRIYNLLGQLNWQVEQHTLKQGGDPNQTVAATFGEFAPNSDRYLTIGDALCLSDLTAFFSRKNRTYHVRGGGTTTFADLRDAPTVLVGAFTNDWNMRLMGELRYSFRQSPDGASQYVYDTRNPSRRDWGISHAWPDWKIPQDYAIVSRVLSTSTGKAEVTAAGITHYGTSAAGEFLTNSDYLKQALRGAPADWAKKNIQIVLLTKVIEGTSGPPQVLATYFW
ncbi:MAG: hypothetical protein JOZ22_21415 [Acidobacteriia bacterium]|nr:hypothetical protein [Terriglobia bacterium]